MSLQNPSGITLASVNRIRAKAQGFDPDQSCPECQNLTLKREDSTLKCATCGEVIVEVSKSQWFRFIESAWPDKRRVASLLTVNTSTMSAEWPPAPVTAYDGFLAQMLASIDAAKTPEDCWDAFLKVIKYLACPEPGCEGVTLKVIP